MGEARDLIGSRDQVTARNPARPGRPGRGTPGGPLTLMRLQSAAGNRAVTALLGQGAPAPLQLLVAGKAVGLRDAESENGPAVPIDAGNTAPARPAPIAAPAAPGAGPDDGVATAEPTQPAAGPAAEPATQPAAEPAAGPAAEPATGPAAGEAREPSAAAPAGAAPAPATEPASPPPAGERAPAVGLANVRRRVTGATRELKQHGSAGGAGAAAVRAAPTPTGEREGLAKAERADEIAAAEPRPFDRAAFIAAVNAAIAQQRPQTLEQADALSKPGSSDGVAAAVRGTVGTGQAAAAAPIAEAARAAPDPSRVPQQEAAPLAQPPALAAPELAAGEATPTPVPTTRVDLSSGPREVDASMAQAGVTEQQLARSNESEFTGALAAKQAGEAHSTQAPADFRVGEATVLAGARAGAQAAGAESATAMTSARTQGLAQVAGSQGATANRMGEVRARLSGQVHAIFDATKSSVGKILDGIAPLVEQQFTAGERAAAAAFQAYHEREMDAFRERRYGGALGWTDWIADKLTSPPPEVNRIIDAARALYASRMNVLVERIADTVATELTRARGAVAAGRQEIAAFVASRPAEERQAAQQAASEAGDQFAQLETSIEDRGAALAEDLATRYSAATAAIDEQVSALREANRGLIDRAKDAVGGAVATILQLKDMLTGVLARAAGAVEQIIADPIAFLGNFANAVKSGVTQFVGNIASHLKRGLQQWLFGALAEAGIEVPDTLDLKGVITLVLQLIGATWANLRARIVKRIGEPAMAAVERGVAVIQLLVTKGIGGLWEWLADKVTSLYDQVIEKIQDFVITKVITAGVTWLISLLNPAAAFIKACRMIYDAVMWFVENAARLHDFVGSVLDSVESIARGGVGAVASLIENAMARTVPMIISGFASLLGLGGIAAKIRSILQTVQKPVGKLIDKIVDTAVRFGKRVAGTFPGRGNGRSADAGLQSALSAGESLLAAPGATPSAIRAALPGLQARYGLREARLVEGSEGHAIEVQRATATTRRRRLGDVAPHGAQGRDPSGTPADQTKQSEHVVPYVVLAEFMRAATATAHDRASSGALDRAQPTVAIYTTAANLKTSREGRLRSGAKGGAAEYYAEVRRQLNIAPARRGPRWQAEFTELYASIRRYLEAVKDEFATLTKQAISDDAATHARSDTNALGSDVDRAADQQIAGLRLLFAHAGRADRDSAHTIEVASLEDLNTMHVTELAMVPGIGPRRATAIVSERAKSPFGSVADLRARVPRLPRSLLSP